MPKTSHGRHDSQTRGMRYLEWVYDPDPDDSTYITDFAYLLREADRSIHIEHDQHINGIFSRREWLNNMKNIGFQARIVSLEHSEIESGLFNALLGINP